MFSGGNWYGKSYEEKELLYQITYWQGNRNYVLLFKLDWNDCEKFLLVILIGILWFFCFVIYCWKWVCVRNLDRRMLWKFEFSQRWVGFFDFLSNFNFFSIFKGFWGFFLHFHSLLIALSIDHLIANLAINKTDYY